MEGGHWDLEKGVLAELRPGEIYSVTTKKTTVQSFFYFWSKQSLIFCFFVSPAGVSLDSSSPSSKLHSRPKGLPVPNVQNVGKSRHALHNRSFEQFHPSDLVEDGPLA
jgi:hypothetical protein